MEGNRFSLPSKINPEELEEHLKSRQCLVVSFFGKSPYNLKSNKGGFIDEVIGKSVFNNRDIDHDNDDTEPVIEGYFCPDRDVIFLHMRSWMDTFSLAEKCRQAEEVLETKGILSFWSGRRYEHARGLLALFHLSHLLVCCSPGHTFDISYVHLFKSLARPAAGAALRTPRPLPLHVVSRAAAGKPGAQVRGLHYFSHFP